MRSRVFTVVVLLAAAVAGTARAGTTLIVTGHGWGHGVGMSQWGAYGYARHGWSYERILRHYYPGTRLVHGGEPDVRVLLVGGAKSVMVGCATQITVSDGGRYTRHLKKGTYRIGARLSLPVGRRGLGRSFGRLAVFRCARGLLTLGGRPYHGRFAVRSNGRSLSVVNTLELDTYVRGVVPSESPSRWPLAELEAQAVAARSYAVAELKPAAPYDLLPDTRDQVYGGASAERPRSDEAVSSTRGEILEWDGQVARTYYSASSGGRTESVQDAWPGAAPIPYLRSVPDPWDRYSPQHDWGPFAFSGPQLAAKLGLPGAVASAVVVRDPSLRAGTVRLRLSSGATADRTGDEVARALDLRSTWFSLGVLTLSARNARVVYGERARVDARCAGVKGAMLEERSGNGAWRTVRPVRGSAAVSLDLRENSSFRLVVPGAPGPVAAVAVVPRLRARALGRRLLGGRVLPRAAGPVLVWRQERGVWKVVSRPHVQANGDFLTPLRLRPTVYRITAGGGPGLDGVTTRVVVTRSLLAGFAR